MTFTVDKSADGRYKISIGTGKTFKTKTLEGVAYGLQHYFRDNLFNNKFDYKKHIEHNKICNCCPLCNNEE